MKRLVLFLAILCYGVNLSYGQTSFMADDSVAVFYPAHFDSSGTLPSLIFDKPLESKGAVPANWSIRPDFQTKDGKPVVSIKYPENADLYGTGEVTGPLRRNGTKVTLWNTDNYEYGKANGRRLYQSHPWVMGVRADGSSFGIIADNTWKQQFDLSDPITVTSEGPAFRVIVIERETPQALLKALGNLTGTMELPPLWTLGYQQSRYTYTPDTTVRNIAQTFRKKQLPADVIWMDIDYMQNYKIFTFDSTAFPHPQKLNDYLHSLDFKSVWMIDPGVKKEKGYDIYDQGTAGNQWVLNKNRDPFVGKVWPGDCVFPDFTRPATRDWWSGLYRDFMAKGMDGVWNDMNEPSVFDGPGGTMPIDNIHRGGGGLPKGTHLRYHDVYGMLMVKATHKGILEANPDKRPFVLSRSNFLGGQKYAATWTGDNNSSWNHFEMSIPMILNLGLSGQPFSGADIGGFTGNTTPQLLGNWMAVGAFYPFSRNHSAKGTDRQEPWQKGKRIENVARTALDRRYRLMPYLYTLFREASTTGLPVMRPVFFADVDDPSLRSEDQAFMLGSDLLIVPKWANNPALPKGEWRKIHIMSKKQETDSYQPDIHIRDGAIVPISNLIQSTEQFSTDSLSLAISLDKNGQATGKLYDDAGDGFAYKDGEYAVWQFKATKQPGSVSVTAQKVGGKLSEDPKTFKVILYTDKGVVESHWQKGNSITVALKRP
ncbi:MAG TPA: TIM-barrel domain-containing protein [Balneolaceae bacterium]|nr:TIM-barrel domain-containing protein [Balneolaceae bacterium]